VAVVVKDGVEAELKFGLSEAQLGTEIDLQRAAGRRPRTATSYRSGAGVVHAVIFEKLPDSLPTSGAAEPRLAALEKTLQGYFHAEGIRGATVAVSRESRLLYSRGFGFRDAEELELLPPDALLRIASVTKPITAIAVRKLMRDGKLRAGTPVFDLLELEPPDGQTLDPRWKQITVEHLLSHRGGWDRDEKTPENPEGFDPMFHPIEIAKSLRVTPPLRPESFVRYMLGQSLQFTPGSKRVYSNFGYCVLGRVIEKASDAEYIECLNQDVFRPLGIKDIRLGRTLLKARDPREPVYLDAGEAENVMDGSGTKVRWPDGGFLLEGMDAHGGLIATAPELIKVLDAYWLNGEPRQSGEFQEWVHFGSLPGTFAMALQRKDGVNVVILMNQRSDGPLADNEKIMPVVNEALDQIKEWP
jgi:N-acyl-D-amino-acid deacylase